MFAHTQPVIDVTLPPQIVVPDLYLVTGHALMLWFDYLAVRHLQPIIGAIRLRLFLAAIHISIPLVFACPSELLNNTLLGTPWYAASYIVYFADKNFSFRESLANVGSTLLVFQENQQATGYVRIQGLAKIARGVFKWALMKSLVDPWLPHGYSQRLLAIPYWSWESLWLTALIGFKVYCIMGLADIGVGSIQCTLGVPIYDIFDSPILAHSPRDFWSRRWNRIVHKIYHQQIFAATIKSGNSNSDDSIKKTKELSSSSSSSSLPPSSLTTPLSRRYIGWSSPSVRGFAVFLVSGIFHELMLMALVRTMTLEQVLFFTLHGVAVWGEIKFGNPQRPTGKHRACSILAHFIFLTMTGRLFLAPFLRPDLFTRIFGF